MNIAIVGLRGMELFMLGLLGLCLVLFSLIGYARLQPYLIKRRRHLSSLNRARLFLAAFNLHAAVLLNPEVTEEDEVAIRRLLCNAAAKLCFPLPLFLDPHQVRCLADSRWPGFLFAHNSRQSLVIFLVATRGQGRIELRLSLLRNSDGMVSELVHVTTSTVLGRRESSLVSSLFQLAYKGGIAFVDEGSPDLAAKLALL